MAKYWLALFLVLLAPPVYASSTLYSNSTSVGIGTTSPTAGTSLDMGSETNSFLSPVGTTAQRPTGVAGMFRYNSTNTIPEFYTTSWLPVPLTASSPIVINSSTGNITCPTCNTSTTRNRLSADQTFYLSTTGSDSNDCLTSGTACATLDHVWGLIATSYDLAGYTATIQLADGTYTDGLEATIPALGGPVIINGDSTTPANVIISTTTDTGVWAKGAGVTFTVQNLEMTSTDEGDLSAEEGAYITMGPGLIFGAVCSPDCSQIDADTGGTIFINNSYSIVGGGGFHYYAASGSSIRLKGASVAVTLTGTSAFGQVFASSLEAATIVLIPITYSGSATGGRYFAEMNGVIDTDTGNTSFLPGNAAGSTVTGGQYN